MFTDTLAQNRSGRIIMHIAIIGAAGMLGRKLTGRLVRSCEMQYRPISRLTLVDVIQPIAPAGFMGGVQAWVSDLSAPGQAERLVATRPELIFHLAAIVSGEAEQDFEKGYSINLDGMRFLLEAIRVANAADGYCPRLVFTSSIAVFGTPFPDRIDDDFFTTPLTSYGTQKAICELLLADYSRKGFVDGIGIRLPTICIRPGKPNLAASGFFSNILREPLVGQEAILPVPDSVRHWFASPRAAIGFLSHAGKLDTTVLGARRTLSMPGVSATVAEQIEALRKLAGQKAVDLIKPVPDERILKIVEGWPGNFTATRATALGFRADTSFEEIIRVHIRDELGGCKS
jgi:D-erythronate 2-dehydrogenase